MAAGLDVAAGVAGLLGLTIEAFGLSYKYVEGVRGASSSAHLLLKELEDLQTVLCAFEKLAKEPDGLEVFGDTGSCLLSIKESDEYFQMLQKIRDKLQQRHRSSSFRDIMKALTWPFSKEDTIAHVKFLHWHLENYNRALSVDNLYVPDLV